MVIQGMKWSPDLRPVEWEVWRLIAEGYDNAQIAAHTNHTKRYIENILRDLKLKLNIPGGHGDATRVKLCLMFPHNLGTLNITEKCIAVMENVNADP